MNRCFSRALAFGDVYDKSCVTRLIVVKRTFWLFGYLWFTEGCASAVVDFGHYFSTEFESGYEILTFCFGQDSGVG